MPRRNSAPVNRSSRRRHLPRRGETIVVFNSLGKAETVKVLAHWGNSLTIKLADGSKAWVPAAGYRS